MSLFFSKSLLASLFALFWGVFSCHAQAQTPSEIQKLIKSKQFSQAKDQSDSLIAKEPKNAQGYFLKGVALSELGKTNEAIAVFTKLTEMHPELPEPYNNLAVLYAQQKEYDKAKNALEMAIRTHPSYATAHENLGDVYAKLASVAYNKALQLDANNASSQTKLAMISDLMSTTQAGKKPSEPIKIAAKEPEPLIPPKSEPPKPAEAPKAEKTKDGKIEVVKPDIKVIEPAKPTAMDHTKPDASKRAETSDASKTLAAWAAAWSRKDVKSYLSYYAPDFVVPGGQSRKAWEQERAARIDKPGKLQVNLSDIRVTENGADKVSVRFRQHYTSATLKTSATKTVVMVRVGNKWLIREERVN